MVLGFDAFAAVHVGTDTGFGSQKVRRTDLYQHKPSGIMARVSLRLDNVPSQSKATVELFDRPSLIWRGAWEIDPAEQAAVAAQSDGRASTYADEDSDKAGAVREAFAVETRHLLNIAATLIDGAAIG